MAGWRPGGFVTGELGAWLAGWLAESAWKVAGSPTSPPLLQCSRVRRACEPGALPRHCPPGRRRGWGLLVMWQVGQYVKRSLGGLNTGGTHVPASLATSPAAVMVKNKLLPPLCSALLPPWPTSHICCLSLCACPATDLPVKNKLPLPLCCTLLPPWPATRGHTSAPSLSLCALPLQPFRFKNKLLPLAFKIMPAFMGHLGNNSVLDEVRARPKQGVQSSVILAWAGWAGQFRSGPCGC